MAGDMTNPLEYVPPLPDMSGVGEEFDRLRTEVREKTVERWAYVYSLSPLRVRLDGDANPLMGTASTIIHESLLAEGDRIRVSLQMGQVTVLGLAEGFIVDLRGDTARRTAAGLSGLMEEGMRFYDTTENLEYVWQSGDWISRSSSWKASTSMLLPNGWNVLSPSSFWAANGPGIAWDSGFVAPVDGRYRATFATSIPAETGLYTSIKKNNLVPDSTGLVANITTGGVAGGTGGTAVAVAVLVAGDRLTPATYTTAPATLGVNWDATTFTVELL